MDNLVIIAVFRSLICKFYQRWTQCRTIGKRTEIWWSWINSVVPSNLFHWIDSVRIRLTLPTEEILLLMTISTWQFERTAIFHLLWEMWKTFVNRCLRNILRIPWTERVRNEVIWERMGHIPVVDEVGRSRWRWIGHTLCRNDLNIARQAKT